MSFLKCYYCNKWIQVSGVGQINYCFQSSLQHTRASIMVFFQDYLLMTEIVKQMLALAASSVSYCRIRCQQIQYHVITSLYLVNFYIMHVICGVYLITCVYCDIIITLFYLIYLYSVFYTIYIAFVLHLFQYFMFEILLEVCLHSLHRFFFFFFFSKLTIKT